MSRTPIRSTIAATYHAFDFLTPTARMPFFVTALKFAAVFAAGWAVQWSGILEPDIARGNEVLAALLILLFLPMVAAVTRRLADAAMPLFLAFLPLLLWGGASAATVMFGWPAGTTLLNWAALASAAALAGALCLPSRAARAAA